MDVRTRQGLRTIAWISFLIGAPLLLAYARGYRFPGPRGGPPPTHPAVGALVFRTIPRGASVSVDGMVVDERTPTGVGSVTAGRHTVVISKAGYRPWRKAVEIVGGSVTAFPSIRLIPEVITEDVVRADVSGAWMSPDRRSIITRRGEEYSLIPFRGVDTAPGRTFTLPRPVGPDVTLTWSPSGEAVAVLALRGSGPPALRALLLPRTLRVLPVPSGMAFAGWERELEEGVFFLDDTATLWRAPLTDLRRPERVQEAVEAVAAHPRGLLVSRAAGKVPPALVLLRPGGAEVLGVPPEPLSDLAVSSTGALAAIGRDSQQLWLFLPDEGTWRALARGGRALQWSPDGEKLLFQESEFDLSVVNVTGAGHPLPPLEPSLLARVSAPLTALRWFPDSAHVLFFTQDVLHFTEIDPRGGHRSESLVSVERSAAPVLVPGDGESLLVLARRGGREVLLRLPLRPAG